ncbi:uncharacterized protein GGS22DRAFT_152644 [Annulohypoxylon maeteangense]|uniref:uncharacterized protein n=1 Tax=Annulohypoxylon maeteangense TaxID=1927788 RepID=UPI002007C9C0|nr:uncharacterized protein GGS22DRAFT_152644 [Annulohypoxylon maeteangense]KAI0888893.1 hypothetical protein GGS22DRAFT_152644 [Annulohypoxylon maeteangense]
MCSGNQTEMACGHVLTHYTSRCEKGPCAEPKSDSPRQHLADSCAECDSEFKKSQLSREQKNRHEELVAQLIADKRVNGSKEARRLLNCMQKLSYTMNREIGEVRTTGFSADVQFPGSGNHRVAPTITSKWVNGKCVWGEEEGLHRSGSSRIKKITPATSTTAAEVEVPAEPLTTALPRLRRTKKEYFNRLPEEKEQPVSTAPPRLRTNKPYTGPRESVVVFGEVLENSQEVRPKPYLRRTKKVTDGLNRSNFSDSGSDVTVKYIGEERDSRASPTEPNARAAALDDDDLYEDIWLKLAEKPFRT